MLLVGDINASLQAGGLQFLLEKMAPELRQGDIVYGNLEFAITDRGQLVRSKNWTDGIANRSMKPADVGALTSAGIHVMSLANNHLMDFGPEGLFQTIELLDGQGIAHCGGGENLSQARKPAFIERNGLRVAFLSYTSVFAASFPATKDRPGVATVRVQTSYTPHPRHFEQPGTPPVIANVPDPEHVAAMQTDIRNARANADLVVVSWHWGVSKRYQRVPYQTEMGRAAIDAGASLIIGHHPHVLQGVEVYKKGVIFYSMGNFVFSLKPGGVPPADRNALLIDCEIDKTGICGMTLRPVQVNTDLQPELVTGKHATRCLDALIRDSEEFATSFRDHGGNLELVLGG